jgi:hypothetical protein
MKIYESLHQYGRTEYSDNCTIKDILRDQGYRPIPRTRLIAYCGRVKTYRTDKSAHTFTITKIEG